MDYYVILVFFIAFCGRIICSPLLAEMMGTGPAPGTSILKTAKLPSKDMPLGKQPALKPETRKIVMAPDNRALMKMPKNSKKTDPALDILSSLDNPLLGSQLDALLGGSKPFNLIGPGLKPMNLVGRTGGPKPFNFLGPRPKPMNQVSPTGGSKPFNLIGPGSKPLNFKTPTRESKALPPKPKGVKSTGKEVSLGLKPGLKPDRRKNGLVSNKNSLPKPQPKTQKTDPALDILRTLDNPLLESQLDALLGGSKPFNLISPGSKPMNLVSPTGGSKPFNLISPGSKPVNLVSPLGASKPMNLVSPFSSYKNPVLEAQLDKIFGAMPAFSQIASMSFSQNPLSEPQASNDQKSKVVSSQKLKTPVLNPSSMRVPAQVVSSKVAEKPSQSKLSKEPLSVSKSKRPPPPRPPAEVGSPSVVAGVVDIKDQTPVASLKRDLPIDALGPLPGNHKQPLHSSNLNQPVDKLSILPGSRDLQPQSQLSNIQGLKAPSQPTPPSSKMQLTTKVGTAPIIQDQLDSLKGGLSEMLPGAPIGPNALKPQVSQNEISAVLDEMAQMINPQTPPSGSNVELGGASSGTPWFSNGGSVSGKKTPTGMSWLAKTRTKAGGNQPVDMPFQVPNGGLSGGTKPSDIPWESQTVDMPFQVPNGGLSGGTKPSDIPWESQAVDMPFQGPNGGLSGGTKPSDIPWESQTGGLAGSKQPLDVPWEQQNKGPVGGTQPVGMPWESQTGGKAGAKPSYDMMLPTKVAGQSGGTLPIDTPLLNTGGGMKGNKPPGLIDMSLLNLGGGFPKSKSPINWLKRDIGSAMREAAPVYTQKKAEPVKTVCTLKGLQHTYYLFG